MAKPQDIGFVDKHIEKVIFGVCLLVAAYMIFQYGLSSPRKIDILGQGVAPDEVDQVILKKAEGVRDKIVSVGEPKYTIPKYLDFLGKEQSAPLPKELASASFGAAAFRGPKSGAPTSLKPVPLADIERVIPKPAAPLGWAGEELFALKSSGSGRGGLALHDLRMTLTLRAASVYPLEELRKAWAKELESTLVIVHTVPIGYEVQIEEILPDGSTQLVENFVQERLMSVDKDGVPVPVVTPKIPAFDGQNASDVRKFVSLFYSTDWSAYQLQPRYYDVLVNGKQTSWQEHLPVEKLLKYFPQPKPEAPGGRPGELPGTPAMPSAPAASPAGPSVGGDLLVAPPSGDAELPAAVERPREPMRAGLEEKKPRLPDVASQKAAGKMLMWFHTNSIQIGKRYRCRMRVILANPLLTYPDAVDLEWKPGQELPKDAVTPTVASPWSDWSVPLGVEKEVYFFLTGANPAGRKVSVTLFTTELGQWVKHELSSVQAGQPLDDQAKVKIRNPLKIGTSAVNTTDGYAPSETTDDSFIDRDVKFISGATVVGLNFDKSIWLNPDRTKENGVEMIYQDADGALKRRILYFDKNSQKYKELLEKAKANAPVRRRVVRPTDERETRRSRTPRRVEEPPNPFEDEPRPTRRRD